MKYTEKFLATIDGSAPDKEVVATAVKMDNEGGIWSYYHYGIGCSITDLLADVPADFDAGDLTVRELDKLESDLYTALYVGQSVFDMDSIY